jgi:hypothetical protein
MTDATAGREETMDDLFGPRQRTLFEAPHADDTVSVAEACVLTLTDRFAREYQERGSPDRVPPELDLAARACLYICAQYPVPASPALLRGIDACRECLQTFSLYRHLDALPFGLCRWLLAGEEKEEEDEYEDEYEDGIPFPVEYLTHGQSSVRYYLFELGWLVRAHLDAETCVPELLTNVADTLGHWFCSLALCRHLFADKDAFWAAAEAFEPEEMAEQYRDRIAWSREHSDHVNYPPCFLNLEQRCARVVHDCIYPMQVRWP